jgi:hypothetical protein
MKKDAEGGKTILYRQEPASVHLMVPGTSYREPVFFLSYKHASLAPITAEKTNSPIRLRSRFFLAP